MSSYDYNEDYNGSKGSGGDNFSRFRCFTVPKDVTFLKPTENGPVSLDVIPHRITTPQHPAVVGGGAKVGDLALGMRYLVHSRIGARGKEYKVICPKTVGKPCPICEFQVEKAREIGLAGADGFWHKKSPATAAIWATEDGKMVKSLFPQERILYNIVSLLDSSNSIQLLDQPERVFDEPLRMAANSYKTRKRLETFRWGSPTEGSTINCDVEMKVPAWGDGKGGEAKPYPTYINFAFEARTSQYNEDVVDTAYPLETFMVIRPYEELRTIFYGGDPDSAARAEEINTPEPVAEPAKVAPAVTTTAPTRTLVRNTPATSPVTVASGPKCPSGHAFGVDFMQKDDCDECAYTKECRAAKRAAAAKVDEDDVPF